MWLKSSFPTAVNPSASPHYYMGPHPLLSLQRTQATPKFVSFLKSISKNGKRLFIYIFKQLQEDSHVYLV